MCTQYEHRPSHDLVCRKINALSLTYKDYRCSHGTLKGLWLTLCCLRLLAWLCFLGGRERMKYCWKRGDQGAEAELIEREARQRASQNTKCLNLNTLEQQSPQKTDVSPRFQIVHECLPEKACEKLVALQSKNRSRYGRFKAWMQKMNSIKSWMPWIKLVDSNAKPPFECMIPELQVSEV